MRKKQMINKAKIILNFKNYNIEGIKKIVQFEKNVYNMYLT